MVKKDDVSIDQGDQAVFVDLPVCITPYAWEQDKDRSKNYIEEIWADLFHSNLLLNWAYCLSKLL